MKPEQIFEQIKKKKSFLCVGLDSDAEKIPAHLKKTDDRIFEFNCRIVDATAPYTIAYKPNIAFYECMGSHGFETLEKTTKYIRTVYPDIFLIADAKRGDIGNTSKMYAKTFFEFFDFDAITVAPYMGEDSVSPFLSYKDKWVILLALTSNKGADDFQYFNNHEGKKLFEQVLEKSQTWDNEKRLMYVVGATRAEMLADIRKIVPDHFLLVPGVGAQGGSLQEVARYGMNKKCGLIVNSSRDIIYASSGLDYAEKAGEKALNIQKQMEELLKEYKVI
jgi:orotidine-5'-phosphate decarboxylase